MRLGQWGLVLGGSALIGFASTAALAQESTDWSGFYVAGFGEYAAGTSTQNDNGYRRRRRVCPPGQHSIGRGEGGAPICVPNGGDGGGETGVVTGVPLGDGHYGVSGAFGGGAIGYNYQFARTIVGLEGSIGGGRASGSSPFCGGPLHQCGTSVDTIADVRGRLGYSFGRVLPFVAGGLAVDHVKAYDTLLGGRGSGWLAGFVVGGGVEYRLTPRLSVRAEYLHTEIRPQYLFDIAPGIPERVGYRSDAVRVGLAYSLTPVATAQPVIARY